MNMRAIAVRAGVSSATVSRVINGSPLVRPDTAERVRKILDEFNFVPNPVATTLKYGRSRTFGLVVPDISNPFFSEFLGAFEELLVVMDHEVLLTTVQNPEMQVKSIRRMLMRQVDGVAIMASEFDSEAIEPLLLRNIPIVTVDRQRVKPGCSDVVADYQRGFTEAAVHLRELGHRRIGYVGGSNGPHTSQVRAEAFTHALKEAGLVYQPDLVCAGDYRITGGEAGAAALLQKPQPPTAILTANDVTAFGVMRAAQKLGLSVPGDLSVIGLDDVLLAQVVHPPLTTIRIPRRRLAKACIEALNYTKEDRERMGRQFSIPTELTVRESTAPPRKRA